MIRIQAQPQAGGESRLAGIQMAMLTLRCMEHYRDVAGDHDSALILLAVVAISAERLTRGGLTDDLGRLDTPLPPELCRDVQCQLDRGRHRLQSRNRPPPRQSPDRARCPAARARRHHPVHRRLYAERPDRRLLQLQLDTLGRSVTEFLRIGAMAMTDE